MKSKLHQYKGGGYDGCIWEWNFCYHDDKGKWHDIFSSGSAGIKKEEDFDIDKIEFTYPLTQEGLDDFAKTSNAQQVLGTLRTLNKGGYDFQLKCSKCETLCDPYEMELIDWHGCGGIAITADNYICSDCLCNGSCGYCGEYIGEEAKRYGENDYCYDCAVLDIQRGIEYNKGLLKKPEFGNPIQIEALRKIRKFQKQLEEIEQEEQE
jgi:hypothetical protein